LLQLHPAPLGCGGAVKSDRSEALKAVAYRKAPECSHRGALLFSGFWGLELVKYVIGEVLNLYKNLLYLGRDYPKGADYFKRRLKNVFLKNKDVKDPEKIKELIERGEFVMKELEALYFLRKYRAMKQRYYSDINKTK
ncbi:Hypothetical predicted protein, partial [Marmota monax]